MMGNYFAEDIEISKIQRFVETVVKYLNKNKTIEGYLKGYKESDSQDIDLDNTYNEVEFN